jgi:hypothetical protein
VIVHLSLVNGIRSETLKFRRLILGFHHRAPEHLAVLASNLKRISVDQRDQTTLIYKSITLIHVTDDMPCRVDGCDRR